MLVQIEKWLDGQDVRLPAAVRMTAALTNQSPAQVALRIVSQRIVRLSRDRRV